MGPLVFTLSLLLSLVSTAFGAAGDSRTLVLRGRVLSASDAPVAGARVISRGSHQGVAMTDDLGRWSLSAALGTAAALAREPFTLELRAEAGGRRLPLVTGGAALVLEVSLVQRNGEAIVRVRSNQAAAAVGVATAFAQEGAVNAWVSADFGGSARPPAETRVVEDAVIPGFVPPPGTPDAGAATAKPPAVEPAPSPAATEPPPQVPPALETPTPRASERAPTARELAARAADSLAWERARRRAADSLAWADARARRSADRAAAKAAERARLDSLAAHRRDLRRADSLAWVARRRRPEAPASASVPAAIPTVARDTGAAVPRATVLPPVPPATPDPVRDTTVAHAEVVVREAPPGERPVSSVLGPRVRRIESFAARPAPDAPDPCACRLHGTVEVAWPGRPAESRLPVTITLDGPASQTRRVELFMGPPREFWFGPIPCGDYRVQVRATGRQRYGLVTGDRPLVVRCEGDGEIRLVLEPLRR